MGKYCSGCGAEWILDEEGIPCCLCTDQCGDRPIIAVEEVIEFRAYCDNDTLLPQRAKSHPDRKPTCAVVRTFTKHDIDTWLCDKCGNGHTISELLESTSHIDDEWPAKQTLRVKLLQAVMFELQQMFAIGCDHDVILETASLLNPVLPGDDFQRLADYIKEWRERKGFHTPSKMGKCNHENAEEYFQANLRCLWCPDCGGRWEAPAENLWQLPVNPSTPGDALLGKMMLVVTELAEAAEAVRHEDWDNFVEELADTFIRLLDLCGTMGIDIKKEIEKKMVVNEGREIRHGKKTRL